jgi:cytochrome c biogenesis protein CcdA
MAKRNAIGSNIGLYTVIALSLIIVVIFVYLYSQLLSAYNTAKSNFNTAKSNFTVLQANYTNLKNLVNTEIRKVGGIVNLSNSTVLIYNRSMNFINTTPLYNFSPQFAGYITIVSKSDSASELTIINKFKSPINNITQKSFVCGVSTSSQSSPCIIPVLPGTIWLYVSDTYVETSGCPAVQQPGWSCEINTYPASGVIDLSITYVN